MIPRLIDGGISFAFKLLGIGRIRFRISFRDFSALMVFFIISNPVGLPKNVMPDMRTDVTRPR